MVDPRTWTELGAVERDRDAGRTLAWLALTLFPMWVPVDYALVPTQWTSFALARALSVALFFVAAIVLHRFSLPIVVRGAPLAILFTAGAAIAWMCAQAGTDAELEYGVGISFVSWAAGLAFTIPWWRMVLVQALVLVPFAFVLASGAIEGAQHVVYIVAFLLTTAVMCSLASHNRLRVFASALETRHALTVAELGMAEEREASRAKTRFLARMSHELRTPLNAIVGYAELVADELADAEITVGQVDLGRIRNAGRHLLALIDDVLDIARIESGDQPFQSEAVDVAALVDDVMGELAAVAAAKGLALTSRVAPDLTPVKTDRKRLRQILVNLGSNAVKFTDVGHVSVHARKTLDGVAFEVSDTGIGIDHAHLDVIFEPFVQVDESTTRRHGGTGLGLPIVRDLVHLLGGRVDVRSTVGVGSTFTVTLPIRDASGDPDPHGRDVLSEPTT